MVFTQEHRLLFRLIVLRSQLNHLTEERALACIDLRSLVENSLQPAKISRNFEIVSYFGV